MKYRSDIDGLRAIAVVAVILHHFYPAAMKGGFIGVDVFFVISGYLITFILCKKLENGTFSYLNFYSKRVNRILPALILVVSVCCAIGYFVMLESEYRLLGKHIASNSLGLLNFALWLEAGYFDQASDLKPLLNLWSLAVEEQFYLVWPLFLAFCSSKRLNKVTFSILIIVISLIINLRLVKHNYSTTAFYLPFSRMWELAIGGVLAQIQLMPRHPAWLKIQPKIDIILSKIIYTDKIIENRGQWKNLISAICFITIIYYLVAFNKFSSFPGKKAILPVLATVGLIASGPTTWINRNILSSKLMVWVGLISYPLYLWHWPLLSFATIMENHQLGVFIKVAIIFLSFVLATGTFYMLEKPIRYGFNSRGTSLILLAFLVSIGLTGFYVYKNDGLPNRQPNLRTLSLGADLNLKKHYRTVSQCDELDLLKANQSVQCHSKSANPEIAIIGDSHAIAMGYGALIQKELNAIFVSYSGGLPFMNHILYSSAHNKKDRIELFRDMTARVTELAKIDSLRYIVLVARGPIYIDGNGFGCELDYSGLTNWKFEPYYNDQAVDRDQEYVNEYVDIIKEILSHGKKVVFSIDIPELGFDPVECIERPVTLTTPEKKLCGVERQIFDERNKKYHSLVNKIKAQVPSLIVHNPTETFCDEKYCYGYKGNKVIYLDDDHLNDYGAKMLVEDLLAQLGL